MRAFQATIFTFVLLALVAGLSTNAFAQDAEQRLKALEERIQRQDAQIEQLRSELSSQKETTSNLSSEIDSYLSKDGAEGWWAEPNTLRAFYKEGLKFETADKAFRLQIGGRTMFDMNFLDADGELKDAFGSDEFENMYEFRRVRLFAEGDVYESIFYKSQFDFAGEGVEFKDVFLGVDLGPLSVRVGNQYEPFGLEEQTSSKYITFMERSYVFAPSRHPGIMVYGNALDGQLYWGAGWFVGESASEGVIETNITGRVAWAPWLENKGEHLVHLGAAVSFRNPDSDEVRFRARPEVHTTTRLIDTHALMVDDYTLLGLEGAFVYGPFSAQGELGWADVSSKDGGDDPSFFSWYFYVSWFLTGEHRAYKNGLFARVKPNSNFLDGNGGTGAFEVAARVSGTDLKDGGVDGGEMTEFTFGVNWYLNPNTRVMFNYLLADVKNDPENVDASLSAFMFRFQIDF